MHGPAYFTGENVKFHGGFLAKMPDFTEFFVVLWTLNTTYLH